MEKGKKERKVEKKTIIKVGVLISVVALLFAIDLVTKYVLDGVLSFDETVTVIPYLFNFKLVYNIGAAWGILGGKQVFLIALSLLFLIIFVAYYCKEKKKTWLLTITFAFLIGGCLGNLFDRIVFGYVRDFIQFAFWQSFPVFNFADAFLSIGVVLFVIYIIIYFVKQYKKPEITSVLPEEKVDDLSEIDNDADELNQKIKVMDEKLKKIDEKCEKNLKKSQKNENLSSNSKKEANKVEEKDE